MLKHRRPCSYFFSSKGCRRGDDCHFSHSQQPNSSEPSTRICNHWLLKGRCTYGDRCRYVHERDPAITGSAVQKFSKRKPSSTKDYLSEHVDVTNQDFFRPLPKLPQKLLSGPEIQDVLAKYLHDNYEFAMTADVYKFWVPFQSAHRSNKRWSGEDGQILLDTIATGNGIRLLRDILVWPHVARDTGNSPLRLSFQRGFYPLLSLLAADFVVKSTRNYRANALYRLVLENIDQFASHLESFVEENISLGSFSLQIAKHDSQRLSGYELFFSLASILFECLMRFKDAAVAYPRLGSLVKFLSQWLETWTDRTTAVEPTFDDLKMAAFSPQTRDLILSHLQAKATVLTQIVERQEASTFNKETEEKDGSYDEDEDEEKPREQGPGALREDGPRNNNDHVDVRDIQIIPTKQELVWDTVTPYLPANAFEAPHHLPAESTERLLDIQFRLLREDLVGTLRVCVQLICGDMLRKSGKKTKLMRLLKANGGKYEGSYNQVDVKFNVYTHVDFIGLPPERRGIMLAQLSFDAPPGAARAEDPEERATYWRNARMRGERLTQSRQVALVWEQDGKIDVYLGMVVTEWVKEITDHVKANRERVSTRVLFYDPAAQYRILKELEGGRPEDVGIRVLVESPARSDVIRPLLEALQVELESLPLKDYLVHRPPGFFRNRPISPPKYARMPGFRYQLSTLFSSDGVVADPTISIGDLDSVNNARQTLRGSRLNHSEADAILDTLMREVSLIHGPPGTEKSSISIDLLRVLVRSARPVLLIAPTNRGLDSVVGDILDAKVTENIVRVGGRVVDERIERYSLHVIEQEAMGESTFELGTDFRYRFKRAKDAQEEYIFFTKEFVTQKVTSRVLTRYLEDNHADHFESLLGPDKWVRLLHDQHGEERERISIYSFWLRAKDIDFLSHSGHDSDSGDDSESECSSSASNTSSCDKSDHGLPDDEESDGRVVSTSASDFFAEVDVSPIPEVPTGDRHLDALLVDAHIWKMSRKERERLHAHWTHDAINLGVPTHEAEFETLWRNDQERQKIYKEDKADIVRLLLREADIIACTTTGAAKFLSSLRGLGPRILVVEDAGFILEAEVLANLFPSIEHLVLIGDVNHRPRIYNRALSGDQPKGLSLDQSLMFRLSSNGFHMSVLQGSRNPTCQHPCDHVSSEDCESCTYEVLDVALPCGHLAPSVPCFQMDTLWIVGCQGRVQKKRPTCEHTVEMGCSEDPTKFLGICDECSLPNNMASLSDW